MGSGWEQGLSLLGWSALEGGGGGVTTDKAGLQSGDWGPLRREAGPSMEKRALVAPAAAQWGRGSCKPPLALPRIDRHCLCIQSVRESAGNRRSLRGSVKILW